MSTDGEWVLTGGEWVRAVPMPFYSRRWFRTRYRCACGEIFSKESTYEAHYRAEHL